MQKTRFGVLLALVAVGFSFPSFSQTITNSELLKKAAAIQAEKEKSLNERLQTLAAQKGWQMVMKRPNGGIAILSGIDDFGNPVYTSTENNILAAATIGTSSLWPGGSLGLTINGSSNNVKGKLAVWDGGRVRSTHVELTGRVLQKDAAVAISDHATHVAGTMAASGVNPLAKGMSYAQQELWAYDFGNDNTEILNDAANLLVSNHSYGEIAGWYFNGDVNPARWEFRGAWGANEDYKMGWYSSKAQLWDSIAYNAPYYLMVKSSGNKRDENGPAVGQPYWRYDAGNVMVSAGNRPAGISSNDGFDIIPSYGVAKNILTVGAVNPIATGYTKASDVVMSSFSSWGPTDDGRIKPDVVADGVGLLSSIGTSDNAYASFSGTSMATPNASGSLLLLQEYYSQTHSGNFMRSATLKGLAIHTADEAGSAAGPDYQFGWGLLNIKKAASVIGNSTGNLIQENVLNNGGTLSIPVIASGNGKISATISWTDPKAEVVEPAATALNNPAKKLVNDLDIVIKKGATTYRPWVLTPSVPSAAATTGDNTLDNVEKVELPDVVPGETYTIEITHKGTLARGLQAYSLIASGIGGTAFCTSGPSSTAGARIDSVSFANVQNKNVAGCTGYSNFTGLTATMQPTQTLPLFIRLNSCDATSVAKIVKVFIDANNDGDFVDAGENVATSAVINGNGDFSGNITVPAGLTPGEYTILRVVMQETSDPATVTPCGTYTRGETQDYKVQISAPAKDVGIVGVVNPRAVDCAASVQYVTVRIRNFGTADAKDINLTTVIKQGTTTIATLTYSYADTIFAGTEATHTYQTPFVSAAGTTYTFTTTSNMLGDQDASNNENTSTVTINAASSNPAGTAVVCGSNTQLTVTSPGSDIYTWYTSATSTAPIGYGTPVTTTTAAATYYLAKNDSSLHIGPATKMAFPQGSYLQYANSTQLRLIFTTDVPLTLETARMYFGQAGIVNLLVRKITNFNYTTGAYSYFPSFDQTYTINAHATSPTPPTPSTPINDPNDPGGIYHLGIDIPEAGTWAIALTNTGNSMVYRNNGLTNPYPYTIPGVMSITGNGAVDNTNPNYYQQFYYFFYDLKVKLAGCPSARVAITPTTVTAPVISLAGNVLTSTAAPNYQWYLNNNPIPGANAQSYTATANGIYTVQVSSGGCTLMSNQINVTTTPVTNVDPSEIGLIASPNPTRTGEFTVQLETNTRANLYMSLVNTVGQKVYQYNLPNFVGRLSQPVKPGKLAAGIYYLQVLHDNKMYVRKIVVAP